MRYQVSAPRETVKVPFRAGSGSWLCRVIVVPKVVYGSDQVREAPKTKLELGEAYDFCGVVACFPIDTW